MKIGLFGGTFDPFHLGHLTIALEAAKKLDRVIIVPTICDYYREDNRKLFTFDERVRIIQEMISNTDPKIEIDTIERNKHSKWRFIDTVECFKNLYSNDDLHVIIGEDSYKNFSTWERWKDILDQCKLMVVQRGKSSLDIEKDIPCGELNIGKNFVESSSTKIRQKLIDELMDMYISDTEWYNDVLVDHSK